MLHFSLCLCRRKGSIKAIVLLIALSDYTRSFFNAVISSSVSSIKLDDKILPAQCQLC